MAISVNANAEGTTTVNPYVAPPISPSITISYENYTCNDGETLQLSYSVLGGSIGAPTWSSSNSTVASVNASGVVTAHSVGTAEISVGAYVTPTSTNNINPYYYIEDSCTITVTLSDGVYYLENKQTKRLAHAYTLANNAQVHQSLFYGADNQAWTFTHLGEGYYSIKLPSGYYLGVSNDSTALNANVVLRTNCNTVGTQWFISKTASGAYKLTPKTGTATDYVLAVSSSATGDNVDLLQGDYVQNNSYRDEWLLVDPQYSFNIQHYYDEGYEVRFDNVPADIAEYQAMCSAILFELFDLDVSFTIENYTSCADECTGTPVTLARTKQVCSHTATHKTRDALFNQSCLEHSPRSNVRTNVVWTGHKLDTGSSASYTDYYVVVITIGMVTDSNSDNKSDAIIRDERIYTLLHELAHQLGAADHYCYDKNSNNCNNPTNDCYRCDNGMTTEPDCLMSYRMYNLEELLESNDLSDIFCDQCLSTIHAKGILTHLNNHHETDG